jgi:hypothetical protein
MDDDVKKKVVNKSFTAILGEIFGAPHGLNLSTSATMSKGESVEKFSGRWAISFDNLATHLPYLLDEYHQFVDGGYWTYVPN